MCCEPVLTYVMEQCHEENVAMGNCVPSLGILAFLKQGTVQIDQLLLVMFSINHFFRF